jgi:hypothetical protein
MRFSTLLLMFFSLIISCHSAESNKNITSGPTLHFPFDPNGRLIYTKHARCRMECRHITSKEIREILDDGQINYSKSEPESKPDPKWAVEGFTAEKQHLRIIIAPEPGKLVVITCIELGVEWHCDCN